MSSRTCVTFSRRQIFQIAKAYALNDYSHTHFKREFGGSDHTFYKILHLAVEQCIVDDDLAQKVMQKAIASSKAKMLENNGDKALADAAAIRVRRSWQRRINKRKNFAFSKKDAKKIAIQYSTNSFSKKEFCRINHIPVSLFDQTLKNAIIQRWISDEVINKLRLKSEHFYGKQKADSFFQKLLENTVSD